jgi:hypothetical protein
VLFVCLFFYLIKVCRGVEICSFSETPQKSKDDVPLSFSQILLVFEKNRKKGKKLNYFLRAGKPVLFYLSFRKCLISLAIMKRSLQNFLEKLSGVAS